jgi:hypothetical protein
MFRFSATVLRQKPSRGLGISPFSMFLIKSKGKTSAQTATERYAKLSEKQINLLKAEAAKHPSFKKSRMLMFHDFIRRRFPKLEGRSGVRMRKIAFEWRVKFPH